MVDTASGSVGSNPVIIIGGGQAAVQLCLALRKQKVATPIMMLSEEAEYPYHRPPLSKSFLSGETGEEKLAMRPVSFYETKDVQVKLNTVVSAIDTVKQTVATESAEFTYEALVVATGARPRPLPLDSAYIDDGHLLDGVHLLRDVQHSRAIKSALEEARNVVVIGAGFIGLEFASVASAMAKNVTVFDTADRVMARAVSPDISSWFEQAHRANNITIRLGDSVREIIGDEKVTRVIASSGEELDCDLLVVGIGVLPNVELAAAAGIDCDNGIIVNKYCETSVANVYAIGDCSYHPNPFYSNKMIRLESVQNATDQARVAAGCIAGNKKPYHAVPWFWSDQGEHSLQMAGLSDAADQFVRRAGATDDNFSVFHFSAAKLQSVDSVNSPRDHMLARKLIAEQVSPTPEQAADPEFDLKSLLP